MRLHNIPPIHPVHNHLRCFGHVINLLVKEFLWYMSKNIILRSVRSVHLTHQTLERKSRTRTQGPYHTTHLTQSDAAPNLQDAPDVAPNPQDPPDAAPNTLDAI